MSQQREQIENNITNALAMLPGMTAANRAMAGKLVYAAVEPWINETKTRIPIAIDERPAPAQKPAECIEAVTAFCKYMLAQTDPDQRPSEFALEQMVNEWIAAGDQSLISK